MTKLEFAIVALLVLLVLCTPLALVYFIQNANTGPSTYDQMQVVKGKTISRIEGDCHHTMVFYFNDGSSLTLQAYKRYFSPTYNALNTAEPK